MTKSIEEQREELAKKYVSLSAPEMTRLQMLWDFKNGFDAGAKARDAQWSAVVNELRSAVHCDYGCKTNQDHGWKVVKCNCGVEKSLIKADQMLKEMGINKGEENVI